MNFNLARQYFYQEIQQLDQQIDLGKAALYIAKEEYPNLDIEEYLNAIDTMASEIQERLPEQRYPLRVLQTINKYLYDDLGFTGNKDDYYDPRNSFLNDVIERRTGIPITLSLLYLEIARRLDFPMVGIGMPGHFMIRPEFENVGIFVDAFNRGEIMFNEDCEERLSQIYQQPISSIPAELLQPVSNRQFLARMLTNLKMIYLSRRNFSSSVAAVERILLLFPDAVMELRDRGLLYYELERWQEAYEDLTTYLTRLPDAEDAEVIRQVLRQLSINN
jgi:regulator of sirC expression with transglutaminase-like and TPR domain